MKYLGRLLVIVALIAAGIWLGRRFYQEHILTQIITRLEADSRAAQVLVTALNYDEATKKNFTTIKFVEYTTTGKALEPKYFTFSGNLIQFQSLVVRFDDRFVAAGDRLKGRSVFLFWKAFCLDGANTKEFPITAVNAVPGGYKIEGRATTYESHFWKEFWSYAFDAQKAQHAGIKSVQIEAPGVVFIPGYLYTIKIEHDGGLRIDTKPLPPILRGEHISLVDLGTFPAEPLKINNLG